MCPPDESVRPPFPGKFANTAVPELGNCWEQGSQGYNQQGREEGAGGGDSQTEAWALAVDPHPLQPPPQARRVPLQHTQISPESRETGFPTPCRKDTPAFWAAHGKGEGANLDSVRWADCAQSLSTTLRVLIS